MAKPLEFKPRVKTAQERLDASVEDNIVSLEESLKLLQELHNSGTLALLQKLAEGGAGGLTASLLQILGGINGMNALRNVASIGKTLAVLDPRETQILGEALTVGLSEGARNVHAGKGVGLPELLRLGADKDVQLALGALTGILKGMGRAMREAKGDTALLGNQGEIDR